MATEKEKSQHGTFIPSLLSILENGPASVVTWSDGGTAFTVHDANRCVSAAVTTRLLATRAGLPAVVLAALCSWQFGGHRQLPRRLPG